MTNYLELGIKEIHELLKTKKIKPLDLVEEAILKIEANQDLNAFITLNKEEARKIALSLENKEVDNILFGLPIAIKDNIVTKGLTTTCASKMLSNFNPIYDASVIEKIKEKNMIIIGKTNMDEFAMGSTGETSFYGPILNPHNKNKVPGGSSSGSAVAISLNLVPLALGSDTGGSIRQPASFCGVVGLRPTYGLVSRYGLIAFASSLDQIGPLTKDVYSNACLLNVISGSDAKDLTCEDRTEDFTRLIGKDIKGLKIAIPNYFMNDVISEEIRDKIKSLVPILESKGCTVDYIDIDYLEYGVPLYQIIALAEASSNLACFDGVRYGYRTSNYENLEELYCKTRGEGFGAEVKRRIMVGSYILSGEKADEYYYKALKVRKVLTEKFSEVFKKYDLLIGPTNTNVAYDLGTHDIDVLKAFYDDLLTIPSNMAGLPAISTPLGKDKNNLPIGLQIIGDKFMEAKIYQLASFIEEELKGGKIC